MATTHVLVVDSDRERAQPILERARSPEWDVSTAIGAPAAQEAIDSRPISLLLVDSSLWNFSGFAGYMAEKHPAIPVVVLTNPDEESTGIVQHLQLGAMTFVPRNARGRQLSETLRNILALTQRNPYRERIRSYLRSGEIEILVGPDTDAIPTVAGYIQRILEDYGLSSERERARVGLAVTEALSNAIIHGCLEVSSEARAELSDLYFQQIEDRRTQQPWAGRAVQINMRFSQSTATFVIHDQGAGFDRASIVDPTDPENLTVPSGRGILLMRAYCDVVTWNDKGNEITLIKNLRPD